MASRFIGLQYREIEPLRRWELLYKDTYFMILDTGITRGLDINLVGVSASDLQVKRELGGQRDDPDSYDGIVNVYISDDAVWAGTWAGFEFRIDPATGEVLENKFTR